MNESGKFLGKPPEVDSAGLDTSPVDGSTLPRTNIEPFSAAASFANTVTGTKILQSPIPNEATGQPVFKVTGTQEAGKSPTDVPTTPTEMKSPISVEYHQLGKISFEITREVEVSDDVVDAAKKGVAMVWNYHSGNQTTIAMDFVPEIVDSNTGETLDIIAGHRTRDSRLKFAVDRIRMKAQGQGEREVGLDEKAITLLYAAHEGTHIVQKHRGDPPPETTHLSADEYSNNRHEVEAWEEALHIVKKLYPNLSFSLSKGNETYFLPKVSKY